MTLEQKDYEKMEAFIEDFLNENLGRILSRQSFASPPQVYEIELRERMVRVEEELKNQRELMKQGFDLMDKRFEQVDKRFEQVDKRFEQVNKRFEQLDKRMFQFMIWTFGTILTASGVVVAILKLT